MAWEELKEENKHTLWMCKMGAQTVKREGAGNEPSRKLAMEVIEKTSYWLGGIKAANPLF